MDTVAPEPSTRAMTISFKRKIYIAIACVLVTVGLAGALAYSRGYYHALRGGLAQDAGDVDQAIVFFKTAYGKNPNAFMVAHDLGCCYALKGDNESCFYWLRIALKTSYGGFVKGFARTERDFDSVRQTAEFRALIDDPPK